MARKAKTPLHPEYNRLSPDKIEADKATLRQQKEQKLAELNAIVGALSYLEQISQPTPTGHGMNRAAERRAQRQAKTASAASKGSKS